jgi:hypothetical protein
MKIERFNEASALVGEIEKLKRVLNSLCFEYKERRNREDFKLQLMVSRNDISISLNGANEIKELFKDKIDVVINEMEEEINYKIKELEKEFKEL